MAYTPGFEYDIFISYAHNDNVPIGGKEGWVDQFHYDLENWLVKRRCLQDLKIWRDRNLHGNTDFSLAIKNKLKNSALFFALTSRNYLQSDYCRQERQWFYRHNSDRPGGLYVGEHCRIMNILLHNIPHQQWPKELKRMGGFSMHDAVGQNLGDFSDCGDDQYKNQLRKIVDAVEETLNGFVEQEQVVPDPKGRVKIMSIFLADAADSLQNDHDRLASDIQESGALVLEDIPPPFECSRHEEQVTSILTRADLSIHLFDQFPGRRIIDKKEQTYTHVQAEFALATEVPQIIWVPSILQTSAIEDENHRQFLDTMEKGVREKEDFEFIRSTLPGLSELIRQKIYDWQCRPQAKNLECSYLIDTHQKDQRHAYKLADILAEKGLNVDFNKECRDPIEGLSTFEQAVSQVENLIIMCGKVAPTWISSRIKKTVKILAEQFAADSVLRLANIWIYLLPESKGRVDLPALPPLLNINIIDNSHSEDIDLQVITSLLPFSLTGGE